MAWRVHPHVTFEEEPYEDDEEIATPLAIPKRQAPMSYSAWKQTHGAPAPNPTPMAEHIPPKRRVRKPKPAFNGSTFTLPEGGTKSQRKIFQTSILKEAYKLIQNHPKLKGKAGAKTRLKICNAAMKQFKSVYEDPNFLYFIQDPQSCQSLIEDFADELEAQLDNA